MQYSSINIQNQQSEYNRPETKKTYHVNDRLLRRDKKSN